MMIRWAAGLLLLTGLAVGAAEPPEQLATAGVAQFTTAYAAWDGAGPSPNAVAGENLAIELQASCRVA